MCNVNVFAVMIFFQLCKTVYNPLKAHETEEAEEAVQFQWTDATTMLFYHEAGE